MNVVVTGATKGIGKAICVLLASKGSNLAICSRNQDDLDQFSQELKEIDRQIDVIAQKCDVSERQQLERFASSVLDRFDRIDVLINNAGIFLPGSVHLEEEGALEQMIETNVYSAYHLSRAVIPRMLSHRHGHIINMCSIASIMAYPNGGSYSISKYALLGFSKVLRAELKDKGIRVTAVLPGATWSHSWEGADFPEDRLMQAGDIAKVVWNTIELGPTAVVEEIIIRPQLGDI